MARRQPLTLALAALITVGIAPAAEARQSLTKRDARTEALAFVTPFTEMLDDQEYPQPRMEPARDCQRVSHVTVRCQFSVNLRNGRVLREHVTVHRQKDGLLGFRLTLDVIEHELN